jgi:nitroreductase
MAGIFFINKAMNPQQLLAGLQWRYATKIFDPSKKIPADVWSALEKTLVLTPTSFCMQPYRFLAVDSPEVREQLLPHSYKQNQVVDASHFVVFTSRTELTEADVDKLIKRCSEIRKVPEESLDGYRNTIVGDVVTGARGKVAPEWAVRQVYIALGNLMTAAAMLRVDACPMEGLDSTEYDRILGLQGSGYTTVVALALGYRAKNDKYATLSKVRYELADLVRHI